MIHILYLMKCCGATVYCVHCTYVFWLSCKSILKRFAGLLTLLLLPSWKMFATNFFFVHLKAKRQVNTPFFSSWLPLQDQLNMRLCLTHGQSLVDGLCVQRVIHLHIKQLTYKIVMNRLIPWVLKVPID